MKKGLTKKFNLFFVLLFFILIIAFFWFNSKIKNIRNGSQQSTLNSTETTFNVFHQAPIYQNITRISFLTEENSENYIHFSTLESYHQNPEGDKFIIYKYNTLTKELKSIIIPGSIEARSMAYSDTINKYVFGTSLDPQILIYNPNNQKIEKIFEKPNSGAWIHRLAIKDDFVYAILSSHHPIQGYEGILKINIKTKQWSIIPFDEELEQGWGKVDTIDPSGRIWFHRYYPINLKWYKNGEIKKRELEGYEDWAIESWDSWSNEHFLIIKKDGVFDKIKVDIETLFVYKNDVRSNIDKLFNKLIPLDFYHQGDSIINSLYYNPKTSEYYKIDKNKREIEYLGKNEKLDGIKILGTINNDIIGWRKGEKNYITFDTIKNTYEEKEIRAPNISTAEISSMILDKDHIYGGGFLTMCNLFKLNIENKNIEILKQAVPRWEGQVHSLLNGLDGNIYGGCYPNSVIFKYDPKSPWNPGTTRANNPINLGSTEGQTYPLKGLQDLDGNIWYKSIGTYNPTSNALIKINFDKQTKEIKTDIVDDFPVIQDLAIYNEKYIILLGDKNEKKNLYLVNQKSFFIEKKSEIKNKEGILLTINPERKEGRKAFLAQNNILYIVNDDLLISPIYEAKGQIIKTLNGEKEEIIIISKNFIEKINNEKGEWQALWEKEIAINEYVSNFTPNTPIIFYKNTIFINDKEKIKKIILSN